MYNERGCPAADQEEAQPWNLAEPGSRSCGYKITFVTGAAADRVASPSPTT